MMICMTIIYKVSVRVVYNSVAVTRVVSSHEPESAFIATYKTGRGSNIVTLICDNAAENLKD